MRKSDLELRDWYAGLAMQAWLEHDMREFGVSDSDDMAEISEAAFKVANSMMDRRQKEMDAEMDAEITAVMASETK
jgi:hypothetical protein